MKGKLILVTGGNGLIGRAVIRELKEEGAIALNLDLHEDDDNPEEKIRCDVTDSVQIKEVTGRITERYGRIDGLVNSAYPRTAAWGTPFEEITHQSLNTHLNQQLGSTIEFCQAVLPQMKKQRSGSIVNIASIYGVVGNDFTLYEGTGMTPPAEYSAIKGGVVNFTRYLASMCGANGIRVNAVSPGGVFDRQPEAFVKAYEKRVPMKRMGRPEDMAPPVLFLLSDGAGYITGHNLLVDGGWTAI